MTMKQETTATVLDPKKLKTKLGFEPTPSQQQVLAGMKRFTILNAGRRYGKSLLCAYLAMKYLLLSKQKVWIVAPSYDLSRKTFNYLTEWVVQKFDKGAFKVNFSTLEITGPYGSKVTCKSADSENSLLGDSLDLLILDEAARLKEEIWTSYLRPTLGDRNGKMVAISTPVGKESWFYRLYLRGQDDAYPDWASFTFPSSSNPHLSKKDLQEAKDTLPSQVYDREYMAKFLDSAYSVFRGVKNCIDLSLPRAPIPGHHHVMGLDTARQQDFTAVTIVDKDTNELIYLDRFSRISYTLQKDRIIEAFNKHKPCKIICDSGSSGGSIIDDLRLALGMYAVEGFSFVGTISKDIKKRGSKARLIEHLAQFIESGSIRIPDNLVLINELEGYGLELSAKGNPTYSAGSGHDDCVDSLALAVWPLESKERKERLMKRKKKEFAAKIAAGRRPPFSQYR